MDFSTLAPRVGPAHQAKFYLAQSTLELVRTVSDRSGVSMSRIVDNILREQLATQVPAAELKRINRPAPIAPKKRAPIKPQEDFQL